MGQQMTTEQAREKGKKGARVRWQRDRYVPPEEMLEADRWEGRQLLAEATWWVALHGVKAAPPDELHRMLQRIKRKNPTLFFNRLEKAIQYLRD